MRRGLSFVNAESILFNHPIVSSSFDVSENGRAGAKGVLVDGHVVVATFDGVYGCGVSFVVTPSSPSGRDFRPSKPWCCWRSCLPSSVLVATLKQE